MGASSDSDDAPACITHGNDSSKNGENMISRALSISFPIGTAPQVDHDVELGDVPAPVTPDIVTNKRGKRMMPPGKREPTIDVSGEPCLREHGKATSVEIEKFTDCCQDSKEKTSRMSLSFDTRNPKRKARSDGALEGTNEHVAFKHGCRWSLRIYQNQVQKILKKSRPLRCSRSNSLPNDLKGPNKIEMKKVARPVLLEKSKHSKIRKRRVMCINKLSMKAQNDKEQRERQKIEKESLHRKIQLFLACMNDIQGERKFYQWKGSVMDSIGGAYLAQNVNDILSSSAFMSLAAKFPREASNASYPVEAYDKAMLNVKAMTQNTGRQRNKKKQDPVLLNDLKDCYSKYHSEKKMFEMPDAIDWDSVRMAKVVDISKAIQIRGMNNNLAKRIKNCVKKLVINFGSTDMEWIRYVPSHKTKEYLMGIYGLGLKSVECIRLLTLQQKAFPIDTNAGRVAVRLGWVPLEKLAEGEEFHLLKEYPKVNSIQIYLWPLLSDLDFPILYELHCQMITFGKIFCTEQRPNCYECPMRGECKYFTSIQARKSTSHVEMDIEDFGLSLNRGTRLKKDMQTSSSTKNARLKEAHTSDMVPIRAVKKTKEATLRTEHQVYVLPDSHPLLAELETRKLKGPCPYLLALSTPESLGRDEKDAVYGTLLIPVRAATGEIFPLNGTFFQPNEVFADDESSEVPVKVPKALLANLVSTTLYCGSNLSFICRGMTYNEVQKCLKSGYVCFRGFNTKTREPKPLPGRFHVPASKAGNKRKKHEE